MTNYRLDYCLGVRIYLHTGVHDYLPFRLLVGGQVQKFDLWNKSMVSTQNAEVLGQVPIHYKEAQSKICKKTF